MILYYTISYDIMLYDITLYNIILCNKLIFHLVGGTGAVAGTGGVALDLM